MNDLHGNEALAKTAQQEKNKQHKFNKFLNNRLLLFLLLLLILLL